MHIYIPRYHYPNTYLNILASFIEVSLIVAVADVVVDANAVAVAAYVA